MRRVAAACSDGAAPSRRFVWGRGLVHRPGEKHWHDASPVTAMTHTAIVEKLKGRSTDRMEKVSDEQYLGRMEI